MQLTRKGEAYARRRESVSDAEANRLRAAIANLLRIRDEAADIAAQLIEELDALDGGDLDAEAAADDDADDADDEPSLGSVTGLGEDTFAACREDVGSQEGWAQGAGDDLEDEHDGREPDDADREPWLGSPNDYLGGADQTRYTAAHDLEDDGDTGIADGDALALHEDEVTSRRAFGEEERLTDPAAAARRILDRHGILGGRRWREPIGPLSGGEFRVVEMGGPHVLVIPGASVFRVPPRFVDAGDGRLVRVTGSVG